MNNLVSSTAILTMGFLGFCLSMSLIFSVKSIARQPEAASAISNTFMIGAGMIEFVIVLVVVKLFIG